MAGIPISQLPQASDNVVDTTDLIPAARPNVGTIRIPGAAFINNVTNATGGLPLVNTKTYSINTGYNTTVKSLTSIGGLNITSTSNMITVDGSYLLSLINTLSSNMASAQSSYTNLLGNASVTNYVVKSSPGTLYFAELSPVYASSPLTNASTECLFIFDKATTPSSQDTPKLTLNINYTSVNGNVSEFGNLKDIFSLSNGVVFNNGIAIVYAGTSPGNVSPSFTSVPSVSSYINIVYS
jgi:hypothetical protein